MHCGLLATNNQNMYNNTTNNNNNQETLPAMDACPLRPPCRQQPSLHHLHFRRRFCHRGTSENRANVNTLLCLLPLHRCLHPDLLCIHSRQSMFQCGCYCLWIPIPTDIDPTSNALTWLPHCWETEGAARACWRDSSCSIIHWYGSDDSH